MFFRLLIALALSALALAASSSSSLLASQKLSLGLENLFADKMTAAAAARLKSTKGVTFRSEEDSEDPEIITTSGPSMNHGLNNKKHFVAISSYSGDNCEGTLGESIGYRLKTCMQYEQGKWGMVTYKAMDNGWSSVTLQKYTDSACMEKKGEGKAREFLNGECNGDSRILVSDDAPSYLPDGTLQTLYNLGDKKDCHNSNHWHSVIHTPLNYCSGRSVVNSCYPNYWGPWWSGYYATGYDSKKCTGESFKYHIPVGKCIATGDSNSTSFALWRADCFMANN
jgi:hypothetical protein